MSLPTFNEEVFHAAERDPELKHLRDSIALAAWHDAKGSRAMAAMYLRSVAHHTRAIVKSRYPEESMNR